MTSIVTTTTTQRELNEIMNLINSGLQDGGNLKSGNFWANTDLSASYSAVPDDTETHFQLSRAAENGVIDRIQSYHRPLAFTIRAKKNSGGLFKPMNPKTAAKIRCWNLGQIRFLANEGTTTKISNRNEVEFWMGGGSERIPSSERETIIENIESKI